VRNLFVVGIVWIVFCIGFGIYIEMEKRHFVENLPQPPQVVEHPKTVSPGIEKRPVAQQESAEGQAQKEQRVQQEYDWRTDTGPTPPSAYAHSDPWKVVQGADDDEERTPPVVWFHIADPYARAEAYRAQLIKQFGERAEIHTLAELKPKVWQHIPLTLDEMIRHAEAQLGLWPTEGTRSSIELFKGWKAEGREVQFQYGAVPSSTPEDERFSDAKTFVREYGREEGMRRFRAAYPAKADELRQYLLKEAPHSGVSPAEIERYFPNVEAPQ